MQEVNNEIHAVEFLNKIKENSMNKKLNEAVLDIKDFKTIGKHLRKLGFVSDENKNSGQEEE